MMNTLILEDNLEQAIFLEKIVKDIYNTDSVHIARDISQAKSLLDNNNFDLFILDIVLNPSDNHCDTGIDFASYIRTQEYYSHTPIIFITSYPEHMQVAINDTHCYSFIIKPYNTETVVKTLLEVADYSNYDSSFFKIKDYTGIIFKIKIKDIIYIESNGHRLTIHTEQSNYDTGEFTLEKISELLPNIFVRCHRKYIINISKACNYDKTNRFIKIKNDTLPVGRTYKTDFEERWSK